MTHIKTIYTHMTHIKTIYKRMTHIKTIDVFFFAHLNSKAVKIESE